VRDAPAILNMKTSSWLLSLRTYQERSYGQVTDSEVPLRWTNSPPEQSLWSSLAATAI
jgi:hypothetical protein